MKRRPGIVLEEVAIAAEPGEVEDVIMGCALQQGATGHNVARQALVRAVNV